MNQKALLKIIYETGFAIDDTVLYLDTHPDCEEALAYYHKMKKSMHRLFPIMKKILVHCLIPV